MFNSYLKLSRYYLFWTLLVLTLYLLLKQFPFVVDLTDNKQHTLSETTLSLLQKISSPITLTLYTDNHETLLAAQVLVQLYQKHHHALSFKHARPTGSDKLLVSIENKHKDIALLSQSQYLNEGLLTKAIFETYRKENQWVAFLQGHGEPKPFGKEKSSLGWFAQALKNQGLNVQSLPLYQTQVIPDNTQLLVIAHPKTELLPKEIDLIQNYIEGGHNILWLSGPNETLSLSPLLTALGLEKLAGTVIDEQGYAMGTPHPAITIIDNYPLHEATQAMNELTAFPWTSAFKPLVPSEYSAQQPHFHITPILSTHAKTWTKISTKTDSLSHSLQFNQAEGDRPGPLHIGFALTRKKHDQEQKIVLIGTDKFLTNSAIRNYGNLSLGMVLSNWLSSDSTLLHIPYPAVKDLSLQLSPWTGWMLEHGLRWVLPLFILFTLFLFQLRRHTRSMHFSKMIQEGDLGLG